MGDERPVICDVGALREPDLATLDTLARLTLAARRLGRSLLLRHASPRLQEFIDFAGLAEVMPCEASPEEE